MKEFIKAIKKENTDIDQCKADLLYLVEPVENWNKKQYLYRALISHLTHPPFNYSRDIAIRAYEDLTDTYPVIRSDY